MQYSHIVVSVLFTLGAFALGLNPIVAALIISAYWAGREVAQAEERYIILHTPNRKRSEMPVMTAYYNPKAWNRKGFWQDMAIPAVAAISIGIMCGFFKGFAF